MSDAHINYAPRPDLSPEKAHKARRHKCYEKGAIMVTRRRTEAKEEFGPDLSLDPLQGAHRKVKDARHFLPRVQEETGDMWTPKVSLNLRDARRQPGGEVEG